MQNKSFPQYEGYNSQSYDNDTFLRNNGEFSVAGGSLANKNLHLMNDSSDIPKQKQQQQQQRYDSSIACPPLTEIRRKGHSINNTRHHHQRRSPRQTGSTAVLGRGDQKQQQQQQQQEDDLNPCIDERINLTNANALVHKFANPCNPGIILGITDNIPGPTPTSSTSSSSDDETSSDEDSLNVIRTATVRRGKGK